MYRLINIYIYIYICIEREREYTLIIHSVSGLGGGPQELQDLLLGQKETTTTCVPSFFCPRSNKTSEVVVRWAFGLYFRQTLLE